MKLNSKERGGSGIMDLFPIILVILFGAYFLLNFGYYIKYMDTLNELENISKKYLLTMETTGGLTNNDLEKLLYELEKLGITNVDMSGTTFYSDDIKYGDEIYLNMTVWVPCKFLVMGEEISMDNNEVKREVNISKCAIALSS